MHNYYPILLSNNSDDDYISSVLLIYLRAFSGSLGFLVFHKHVSDSQGIIPLTGKQVCQSFYYSHRCDVSMMWSLLTLQLTVSVRTLVSSFFSFSFILDSFDKEHNH